MTTKKNTPATANLLAAYGNRRAELDYAAKVGSVHLPVQLRGEIFTELEPLIEALWVESQP